MKKNSQRFPKPKPTPPKAAPATARTLSEPSQRAVHEAQTVEKRKVGVVSGTPADTLDEVAEHNSNKWVAIYISALAVLLAIGVMGGAHETKTAQQAGFNVVDTYAYYQAKLIRQGQLKLALDQLKLRTAESPNPDAAPEAVRSLLTANAANYQTEIAHLETDGKNGKKELQAKAENCENVRREALAKDPYFDYAGALIQIAIVLASASIIAGTPLLIWGSGLTGVLGVLFMLNGFTLMFTGPPEVKTERAAELAKAGVKLELKCVDE